MPYKLLGKGMVYHYYTQNPKASQKWVEPVEETHIAWEQNRAGLAPQSGQIACAGNPPHKNALFEGNAHLKYCPLWRFSPQAKGLPCSRYWLDPRTVLLPTPECKARLYHYYTYVVVVHHAFAQGLIRHAWGAFLADVGQNPKASQKLVEPEEETHVAWEQNRVGLAPQSGQIACAENPPHKKAFLRVVPISSIVRFRDFHLRPRACLVADIGLTPARFCCQHLSANFPHKLFVCFGEPNPHSFVLKRHEFPP